MNNSKQMPEKLAEKFFDDYDKYEEQRRRKTRAWTNVAIVLAIILGCLAIALTSCSSATTTEDDTSILPVHGTWKYGVYDTTTGIPLGTAMMTIHSDGQGSFVDDGGQISVGLAYRFDDHTHVLVPIPWSDAIARTGDSVTESAIRVCHNDSNYLVTDYKLFQSIHVATISGTKSTVEYSDGKAETGLSNCQKVKTTKQGYSREYYYVKGTGLVREVRGGKLWITLQEYRP
jgi:hypothetical protein